MSLLRKKLQLTFLLSALSVTLLAPSVGTTARSGWDNHVLVASSVLPVEPECQGTGCGVVAFTWDAAKEQYKVRNNSTDRWVLVEGANLVAHASLCIGPGKSDYLTLKTVVGAFRANLAEESCGKRT